MKQRLAGQIIAIGMVMTLQSSRACAQTPASVPGEATPSPKILMVSIDGMRADYLAEADRYKLRIPVLRRLIREGTTARRMRTIFPSVTYPAHVTLLTGEPPARHGIPNNERFQPLVERNADWYWSARDIQTPTLIDAFQCAGLHTAAIGWPVSVDAPADYLFPELWTASSFDGTYVARSRATATPGLVEAAEKEFNFTLQMEHIEEQKALLARHVVRRHRPDLLLVHFDEVDRKQHQSGPAVPEVFAALEVIDGLIGEIIEEYGHAGLGERLITCVVSDHGFEAVNRMFKPNAVLRQVGLIDYDDQMKCITGWRAKAWVSGASGGIILANPADRASLDRARTALAQYAGRAESPISRFLDRDQIEKLGSNPQCAFMFDAGTGWMYSRSTGGDPVGAAPIRGMHGQMPDRPQLAASFIIAGPLIPKGRIMDEIRILDVAPTLAVLARVHLGNTTGQSVFSAATGR